MDRPARLERSVQQIPAKTSQSGSDMTAFISYAREDGVAAQRAFTDLSAAGASPWLDVHDHIPGQNWRNVITAAISRNRYFLALLSTNSLEKRGYVQKELKDALAILDEFPSTQIYVIPARLEPCTSADLRLGDLHWVDLFPSWEDGITRIMSAMGAGPAEPTDALEQSELDRLVAGVIDTHDLSTPESWDDHLSLLYWEFDGDETRFIVWDQNRKQLLKYFLSYGGVRWHGPYSVNESDGEFVRRRLNLGGAVC